MSNPLATYTEPSLSDGESDVGVKKPIFAPFAAEPRIERLGLIAAVALQVIVLVVMVFGNTVPFHGARTVLLRVVPVRTPATSFAATM